MKMLCMAACLAAGLMTFTVPAVAADGDIELGFAGGWLEVTGAEINPAFGASDSLAGTEDGSVLYSGGRPLFVWKFNADGTSDGNFGLGGFGAVMEPLPPNLDMGPGSGRGMVRMGSGDIFVSAALTGASQAGLRLCKMDKDGFASTFAVNNQPCVDVIYSNSGSLQHSPLTMVDDGAGGVWELGVKGDLIHILASGQIDPLIPGGRFFLPDVALYQIQPYGLAVADDGSVFVAGQAVDNGFFRGYAAKVVMGPNGPQLDPGFGTGGVKFVGCGTDPVNDPLSRCIFARVAVRKNDVFFYGVGRYANYNVVLAQLDRTSGALLNPVLPFPGIGGALDSNPSGIAIEANGDAVIAGYALTGNPFQLQRAFVARVSAHCAGAPVLDSTRFAAPLGWSTINYGQDVPSAGGAVVLGVKRLYLGGTIENSDPKRPVISAFSDGSAVFDRIFADGFEGCQ